MSPSPLLTPELNAGVTQDVRESTKQLLAMIKELRFLACEPASPKDPSGAVQYCYYRADLGSAKLDLGFGLSRNGRLANPQGQME